MFRLIVDAPAESPLPIDGVSAAIDGASAIDGAEAIPPPGQAHVEQGAAARGTCLIALVLSACGLSGYGGPQQLRAAPGPELQPGPTYEVKLGNVGGLGQVLVTGQD